MSAAPPLPPKQSKLGIFSLSVGLFCALLAVFVLWKGHPSRIVQVIRAAATIIGTLLAVLGFVLGLSALAMRGVRRGLPSIAATLNLLLIAVLVWQATQLIPAIFRRAGDSWSEFRESLQSGSNNEGKWTERGIAAAKTPIVIPPGALTWKDVRLKHLHWADEMMGAAYDVHGAHDPNWDADVHALIRQTMLAWIQDAEAPAAKERRALAEKIQMAGCDDPLVLLLASQGGIRTKSKIDLLRRAADGLTGHGYSPALRFLALEKLRDTTSNDPSKPNQVKFSDLLEALRLALSEKTLSADDYWVWNSFLTASGRGSLLEKHGEDVCAMIDSIPGVEEWFKQCLRGRCETWLGWHVFDKGGAYRSKESQGHFVKAKQAFVRAWDLNPHNPGAAAGMISVAAYTDDITEARVWFDRAVGIWFDSIECYNAMRAGLTSYGGDEALLEFGRACANTGRYDTRVPWQLQTLVKEAAENADDSNAFYTERAPWKELQQMCEGYLHTPSLAAGLPFYHSQYAILAAKCDHPEISREQLTALDFKLTAKVAREWKLDPVDWPQRIAAETSASGAQVKSAQAEEEQGHHDAALASYTAINKTSGLSPLESAYIARRLLIVQQTVALEAADWRPCIPDQHHEGWRSTEGEWSFPAPGAAEANALSSASLVREKSPGAFFELRGEFDLKPSNGKDAQAIIGFDVDSNAANWNHVCFGRTAERSDFLAFSDSSDYFQATPSPKYTDHNRFLIRVDGDTVSVTINDVELIRRRPISSMVRDGAKTRLSLEAEAPGAGSVRFEKIELRTAAAKPAQ